MNELIRLATVELAGFLNEKLPALSPDWWLRHVVERLSFQQQRMVQGRGLKSMQQLDFAALLRVLDQDWYELSGAHGLPREVRTWVRELQTVRNKWAHLSAETMPESELYRDADTLGRLMAAIGAAPTLLEEKSHRACGHDRDAADDRRRCRGTGARTSTAGEGERGRFGFRLACSRDNVSGR